MPTTLYVIHQTTVHFSNREACRGNRNAGRHQFYSMLS